MLAGSVLSEEMHLSWVLWGFCIAQGRDDLKAADDSEESRGSDADLSRKLLEASVDR